MSNVSKTSLQSSNFWTNIVTAAIGVLLAFFTPDLPTAGEISGEVASLIATIKTANYGLLITALFNIGNVLYHLFRKK